MQGPENQEQGLDPEVEVEELVERAGEYMSSPPPSMEEQLRNVGKWLREMQPGYEYTVRCVGDRIIVTVTWDPPYEGEHLRWGPAR